MRRILFATLLLGATTTGLVAQAGPVRLTDAQMNTVRAGVADVFNNNLQTIVVNSSGGDEATIISDSSGGDEATIISDISQTFESYD